MKLGYARCLGSEVRSGWPQSNPSLPPPSPARARKLYSALLYDAPNWSPKIPIFLLSFASSRKGEGRSGWVLSQPAPAGRAGRSRACCHRGGGGGPQKARASVYTCLRPPHLPRPGALGYGSVEGLAQKTSEIRGGVPWSPARALPQLISPLTFGASPASPLPAHRAGSRGPRCRARRMDLEGSPPPDAQRQQSSDITQI